MRCPTPEMNPTQISVPAKSGAQGDSIENFVLDRVSGDVEKNLGQVLESMLEGASVPIAALIVLDGPSQIRRAYAFTSASVVADLRDPVANDRQQAIEEAIFAILDEPAGGTGTTLELADTESTLKNKAWNVEGLTQTAETGGSSGLELIDKLFVPSKRSYSIGSLVAKLEDLALTNQVVAIYVNQAFPEVLVYSAESAGVFVPSALTEIAPASIAQVNAIFVAGSSDSNPSFGFEGGGGF